MTRECDYLSFTFKPLTSSCWIIKKCWALWENITVRWKVERWKIEATSASSEKSCGHGVKFGGTNAVAIPVLVSPWSPVDVRTISQWATPLQSMGQRKIFTDIWLWHQKGIELHQKVDWLDHSAFFQWLSLTGLIRHQAAATPSSKQSHVRSQRFMESILLNCNI